jgi:hypothetical protein
VATVPHPRLDRRPTPPARGSGWSQLPRGGVGERTLQAGPFGIQPLACPRRGVGWHIAQSLFDRAEAHPQFLGGRGVLAWHDVILGDGGGTWRSVRVGLPCADMAILVDAAIWAYRQRRWAHLVSDHSFDELHDFAGQLGLRRAWFQGDHYDVPTEVRREAIALGAQPVSASELVRRLRASGLRQRSRIPRLPGE